MQINPWRPTVLRQVMAAALSSLVLAAAAPPADAAAKAAPKPWTGVWVFAGGPLDVHFENFVFSPGRTPEGADSPYPPEPLPKFKGKYLETFNAKTKALTGGDPVGDSGAACRPQGMPRFWLGPYAFEIMQTPTQINIFQEWNEQTRRIYLDGRKHPADADPTFNGHSVGHWEGDTLVVDTANIRADTGVGQQDQGVHSEALHIVERFKPAGPDLLDVQMTATDPEAFAEPWVATYRLHRKPEMEIAEYICAENNRNPVGEDGRTQTLLRSQ